MAIKKMKVFPLKSSMVLKCVICDVLLHGRTDKKFCSIHCKNAYHKMRRNQNSLFVERIDKILHRNRIILVELFEKSPAEKFLVPKARLARHGFRFNYFTSTYINKQGKRYQYIYDFAWMEFSSQDVLIIKRKGGF